MKIGNICLPWLQNYKSDLLSQWSAICTTAWAHVGFITFSLVFVWRIVDFWILAILLKAWAAIPIIGDISFCMLLSAKIKSFTSSIMSPLPNCYVKSSGLSRVIFKTYWCCCTVYFVCFLLYALYTGKEANIICEMRIVAMQWVPLLVILVYHRWSECNHPCYGKPFGRNRSKDWTVYSRHMWKTNNSSNATKILVPAIQNLFFRILSHFHVGSMVCMSRLLAFPLLTVLSLTSRFWCYPTTSSSSLPRHLDHHQSFAHIFSCSQYMPVPLQPTFLHVLG